MSVNGKLTLDGHAETFNVNCHQNSEADCSLGPIAYLSIKEFNVKITPTTIRKAALRLALTAALSASIGLVSAQAPAMAKPAEGMSHSMMSGMDNMKQMKSTGDVDNDFAMMMKMHHEGALDMAKIELASGKSPELKKMAKEIIASQTKEIARFDKWLKSHP